MAYEVTEHGLRQAGVTRVVTDKWVTVRKTRLNVSSPRILNALFASSLFAI